MSAIGDLAKEYDLYDDRVIVRVECSVRELREVATLEAQLSSRPEVVQIIFRNDSDRTQMAGSNAWFVGPGYALAIIRTDMNNSPAVKLPGQDEVVRALNALKCPRTDAASTTSEETK